VGSLAGQSNGQIAVDALGPIAAKSVGDIGTSLAKKAEKEAQDYKDQAAKAAANNDLVAAAELTEKAKAAAATAENWGDNGIYRVGLHAATQGMLGSLANGHAGALESAAGVVGGNLGQQLGAELGKGEAKRLGLDDEKSAALINAYQNTGAALGGMVAGAVAAGASGNALDGGALLAAAQGSNSAKTVDDFNRQLHQVEIQRLAGLTSEFKRRLKSMGIEISDKEALNRLLAQAAKDVDSAQFTNRENDVVAEAFLSLNRVGTFTVDGKLYKSLQAQSNEEKNDHSLFKDSYNDYKSLYTSAASSKPQTAYISLLEGMEVGYWKSRMTTKERSNASMAIATGDAKALAAMAKSAGEFALDTLILGDTNAVGTKIYDDASDRMNERLAAVTAAIMPPVATAGKAYDGMRQQLAEINSLRAQGRLDEANEKLGELGTQVVAAGKGFTGTAATVANVAKSINALKAGKLGAGFGCCRCFAGRLLGTEIIN
jgi:hypothetical protein